MLPRKYRTIHFLSLGIIVLGVAVIGYLFAEAGALAAPGKEPEDGKLRTLLQERLTTLREAAAVTTKAYQTGIESFAEVMVANQAVRNAELEMCTTDKERIALLEKMATEAADYERTAAKRAATGLVPASSGLKAKVNRLEVEIALERIKGKS